MKRHLPTLAALLAVGLIATWPLMSPSVLFGAAVGHPYGDMPDHYWGTWWFGGELMAGRIPTQTNLSHYPEMLSLWYVDPLGALIALGLRPLGFPAAWNLMLLIQILLGGVAAYVVGHRVSASRVGGLVAGTIVAASPFGLGLLHSGLSEYLGLAAPVLFCASLLRTMGLDPAGRAPPKYGAWITGGLLALCGVQALYYLVFAALLTACAVPGPGWRERLNRFIRIGVISAVCALPLLWMSLSTLSGDGAVSGDNAPGWTATLPATDLQTFFRPGEYYFPDTIAMGNPGILHVNYLGWIAVALCVLGVFSAKRRGGWRTLLGWSVLSMGPRLAWGKALVAVGQMTLLLPLGLLYFPGSPLQEIHQPYRMVAFLIPLIAIFAAVGVARLPPAAGYGLAAAVLLEGILVSPGPWPIETRPLPDSVVHTQLEPGPVLDWPPNASTANRDYLMAQTLHGQPVPYGVNVFLQEDLRKDPLIHNLLKALENLGDNARNRDVPFMGRVLTEPNSGMSTLADDGFRYIVVHRDELSPLEWGRTENMLKRGLGDPTLITKDEVVWTLK